METVIWALVVLFVLFTALGIIATVKTARAVRRGVERTSAQVRRTVEETTLKARSAQPGPVGEAARIRMELRSSLDSTRAALTAGASDDPALREAAALLDQLQVHARGLDGELRHLMEREPDRGRIAARLPEARERAAALRKSADSLRFAAQDRAHQYDQDGLDALRDQIEIESGALRGFREPPSLDVPSRETTTPPEAGAAQADATQVDAAQAEPGRAEPTQVEPRPLEPRRTQKPLWPEPQQPEASTAEQHWSQAPTVPGIDLGPGGSTERSAEPPADRRTDPRNDRRT